MARPKKTDLNALNPQTIYLHNATEHSVEINGKVVDSGDAVSLPVELEEEAKAKGLV